MGSVGNLGNSSNPDYQPIKIPAPESGLEARRVRIWISGVNLAQTVLARSHLSVSVAEGRVAVAVLIGGGDGERVRRRIVEIMAG
jgi:hypothetical protein